MSYPVSIQNFYKAVMIAHVSHILELKGETFDGNLELAVLDNPEILDVEYLRLNGGMLTYADLYQAAMGDDSPLMREYLLGMYKGIERYGHSLDTNFDYMIDPADNDKQVYLTGNDLVEFYNFTLIPE